MSTPADEQDDNKTPPGFSPVVGDVPTIIQDDKQLREAIAEIVVLNRNGTMLGRSQSIDDLLALFTTAQLQLVTELLSHKSVLTLRGYEGNRREELEIVPVSALEHKKQELERGK